MGITDVILAFFSAFGIICAFWLAVSATFFPMRKKQCTVVADCASDISELRGVAAALDWYSDGGLGDFTLLLVDFGCGEESLHAAKELCEKSSRVKMCDCSQLRKILN